MADEIEVATFGEALAVFRAEVATPLAAAVMFRRAVAGAESNLAIGLARLGHRVSWSGRVGDDSQGRLVIRALLAERVETGGVVVDHEAPTGLMIRDVVLGRAIDVSYYRANSAGSRLCTDDLDLAMISSARVLAVSGVTAALSASALDATLAAVTAAREAGVTVVFDPNIRLKVAPLSAQLDGLRQLAKQADILLAGEEEGRQISGLAAQDQSLADWFLGQGCRQVVFKNGDRGCWASDGRQTISQPAFVVQPVDPVGAGDAFAAGYISGLLRGDALEDCLRRAAACGAMNVSVAGDFEGSPTEAELQRFLAGGHDVHR